MKYNPQKHHRRSIRLKGYDYSQAGLYFITICAQNRACLFGNIVVGAPLVGAQMGAQMVLNDGGKMVETEWLKLPERFPNIEFHEYVVMPNHFHGILQIVDLSSMGKTVGDMLDAFKSITTVEYIHGVKTLGWEPFNRKLWQRNYHEHIIRDEQSYQRISDYIINNPANWKDDKFYNQ